VATAVWFDCDGTLVDLERPYTQLLEATFEAELGRSSNDLVDRYSQRFFRALSEAEPEPYRRGMAAALDPLADAPAPAGLVAELNEREVAATTPVDGAAAVLAALSDRPVGVLTNGVAELQRAKLEACDLDEHVDAVVASADVGAVKPDADVFAAARERLSADEHVLIGDDRQGDVVGAREVGFEALHLDPAVDVGTVPSLATVAALLE
jgi:putative hydrolase of the HAD superfamily